MSISIQTNVTSLFAQQALSDKHEFREPDYSAADVRLSD